VALPACADWFHKVVRYRCDTKADLLVISYDGAYNEAGERLVRNKGPNDWIPSDLIKADRRKEVRTGSRTISKQCRLSNGVYLVEMTGRYSNAHPAQYCGGFETVALVIRKDKTMLFNQAFEEGGCGSDSELDVVTEVSISPSSLTPAIRTVRNDDFYK
jgi:hypothetical protein